jgi:hypothetical protein
MSRIDQNMLAGQYYANNLTIPGMDSYQQNFAMGGGWGVNPD